MLQIKTLKDQKNFLKVRNIRKQYAKNTIVKSH